MSKYIRKGDQVKVIAGNDRGKIGKVLQVLKKRILVKGINVRKRHQKARSQEEPAQILELEKSIHKSNVQLCVDGKTPVRLKCQLDNQGVKELYYLEGDNKVTYRSIKENIKS